MVSAVGARAGPGDAGEALALGLVDELVVGQAALVHRRALVLHVGLGALALGGLLGHARLLLGGLRAGLALRRGLPVLGRDGLATREQLTLGLLSISSCAHAREHHEQGDDDERHHDDGDDCSGGHLGLPSLGHGPG